MELANQTLPWAYDILSIVEVARLMRKIATQMNDLKNASEDRRDGILAKTLTLLNVMFWTGSDLERACKLRVVTTMETHGDQHDFVFELNDPKTQSQWCLRGLTPDYATTLHGRPEEIRKQADFIKLPDIANTAWFIRLLRNWNGDNKQEAPRLFLDNVEFHRKYLRKWLSGNFPGGRITESKISGFLKGQLFADTGDHAVVAAITGIPHRLAQVRIFYTSPKVQYLQQLHGLTVNRIRTRIANALGPSLPKDKRPATDIDPVVSVGSRLCPTRDAVRTMVARLRDDISTAEQYCDRGGFVRYHNLYTLYSVLAFGYATTCRAITIPYLPPDSIDFESGLASLSDKDDHTCHKTRLVWIPDFLRTHMTYYHQHLEMLRPQLPHTRRQAMNEPCLFLDENLCPVEVRPGTLEPLLEPYLQVPANTHRRFIRTELIETGCPPEVVDALMGHWQQGEEPFGRFSSFSFAAYVDELKQHLLPLLDDIGFGPLPSHLAQ